MASLSACTGGSPPAATILPAPQPGATVAPTPDLARFYAQRATWTGCSGGFQCSTISVPLDYAKPAARSITLALIRLPARDASKRIGSLLVNPGGPGVSGVQFVREAGKGFDRSLLNRYDLIGFDPRGVGSSTPVQCVTDKQQDALIAYDGSPDSPAEEQGLLSISRSFAQGCQTQSGDLLAHIGTVDAARDMDVIRAVMGDAVLHYYGASYGTLLGATYADEFPTKVGRMVLDGALDPQLTADALSRGQLVGFQGALESFLRDCVQRKDCPVGRTVSGGLTKIAALLAAADRQPMVSPTSGRVATQSLVVLGLLFPLYDRQGGWPALRLALAQANQGNPDILLAIADQYSDRDKNGHYTTNENAANYAINCVDRPDGSTLDQTRALAGQFERISPLFGAYFAWSDLPCTVWPVKSQAQPHSVRAVGAPPILVLGTTRDPATPYQWAVNMAKELTSGRLLTRVGDGHTAYTRGSACIDQAVDSYLLTGAMSPVGKVCH